MGSIVSCLRPRNDGAPFFVGVYTPEREGLTKHGPAHQAFVPRGDGLETLRLNRNVTFDRPGYRRHLLGWLDTLRRDLDQCGICEALDQSSVRTLEMIIAPQSARGD